MNSENIVKHLKISEALTIVRKILQKKTIRESHK
jgi:hypothetical protein